MALSSVNIMGTSDAFSDTAFDMDQALREHTTVRKSNCERCRENQQIIQLRAVAAAGEQRAAKVEAEQRDMTL